MTCRCCDFKWFKRGFKEAEKTVKLSLYDGGLMQILNILSDDDNTNSNYY